MMLRLGGRNLQVSLLLMFGSIFRVILALLGSDRRGTGSCCMSFVGSCSVFPVPPIIRRNSRLRVEHGRMEPLLSISLQFLTTLATLFLTMHDGSKLHIDHSIFAVLDCILSSSTHTLTNAALWIIPHTFHH